MPQTKYPLPFGDQVNREEFLAVKQLILEEPNRLFMEGFCFLGSPVLSPKDREALCLDSGQDTFVVGCDRHDMPHTWQEPACHTAGCLAGWVNMRENKRKNLHLWEDVTDIARAGKILGVPSEFLDNLFFSNHWPQPFQSRYRSHSSTQEERARAAADYIDWILGDYPESEKVICSGELTQRIQDYRRDQGEA